MGNEPRTRARLSRAAPLLLFAGSLLLFLANGREMSVALSALVLLNHAANGAGWWGGWSGYGHHAEALVASSYLEEGDVDRAELRARRALSRPADAPDAAANLLEIGRRRAPARR